MKKMKLILSWVMRILVSMGFLLASLGKLSNNPEVILMFKNWGYPDGFHFITGVLELILAILLVIPKTLKIAIVGLGLIMIAALITHLLNDPILEIIRPLIFLAFLGGIHYLINVLKRNEGLKINA